MGDIVSSIAGHQQPMQNLPEIFELRTAYSKLVDVMLCLLHEAERLEIKVSTYELVKAVFLADRRHLNLYGRPITYDRYLAMRNGPVGHSFYNMIQEDPMILKHTGPVRWQRRVSEQPRKRYWADRGPIYEYFAPERLADLDYVLSESDVEELEEALREVKRLGIGGVWRRTHRDRAYRAAWIRDGGQNSYPMNMVHMFDRATAEHVADLKLYNENVR